MSLSYNLVDEPFIPCIMPNGQLIEFGLRETLVRAHEIREIRDDSPPITLSLHRLLLAILHRIFGPRSIAEWKALWDAKRWDADMVGSYLDTWRARLDLCSESHPFYQVAVLPEAQEAALSRMAHVGANNAALFDHRIEDSPDLVPAPVAARLLITYQPFAVGGGVSKPFNFCHAPLIGGYFVFVRGRNLFESLLLNMVRYADDRPMPATPDDKPAWEADDRRDMPRDGTPVRGYLDYLTWQSRRILLVPIEVGGVLCFAKLRMLQGHRLPEEYRALEPMAALRVDKKKGVLARRLLEARSLWRDSGALLSRHTEEDRRPEVIEWVSQLLRSDALPESFPLGLACVGLATDQAKIELWRHETYALPMQYLTDEGLQEHLRSAVSSAEGVATVMHSSCRRLAEQILAPQEDRRPDSGTVDKLVLALGYDRRYWSRLETPFRELLVELPGDDDHQFTRLGAWVELICRVAREVFDHIMVNLNQSSRTLRAAVNARRALDSGLYEIAKPYKETVDE